jgi:hypothetical protein
MRGAAILAGADIPAGATVAGPSNSCVEVANYESSSLSSMNSRKRNILCHYPAPNVDPLSHFLLIISSNIKQ